MPALDVSQAMHRNIQIWLVMVSGLFVAGIAANLIQNRIVQSGQAASSLLGLFQIVALLVLAVSVIPSLVWSVVLFRRERKKDFLGLLVAAAIGAACCAMVFFSSFLHFAA